MTKSLRNEKRPVTPSLPVVCVRLPWDISSTRCAVAGKAVKILQFLFSFLIFPKPTHRLHRKKSVACKSCSEPQPHYGPQAAPAAYHQ